MQCSRAVLIRYESEKNMVRWFEPGGDPNPRHKSTSPPPPTTDDTTAPIISDRLFWLEPVYSKVRSETSGRCVKDESYVSTEFYLFGLPWLRQSIYSLHNKLCPVPRISDIDTLDN